MATFPSKIGAGVNFGGGSTGPPPPAPYMPQKPKKLTVAGMMNQQQHGPNWSGMYDPRDGHEIQTDEAQARGPFKMSPMSAGGRGRGGVGGTGHGGYGVQQQPRSRISSAGVAGGIPTSARMREEAGFNGGMSVSDVSAVMRDRNGLTNSKRFGMMGQLPFAQAPLTPSTQTATPSFDITASVLTGGPQGNASPYSAYDDLTGIPQLTGGPVIGANSPLNPDGTFKTFAHGSKDTGKHDQLALVGERGPEVVVMPARSKVVPNHKLAPDMASYATGTDWNPNELASMKMLNTVTGARPIVSAPVNAYSANPYAASPNAFLQDAAGKSQDLAARVAAWRDAGVKEGRAAVKGVQAQQAQDAEDLKKWRANNLKPQGTVMDEDGGGQLYQTPYGTAIVGGTRPKVFTGDSGAQYGSPAEMRVVEDRERARAKGERATAVAAMKGKPIPQGAWGDMAQWSNGAGRPSVSATPRLIGAAPQMAQAQVPAVVATPEVSHGEKIDRELAFNGAGPLPKLTQPVPTTLAELMADVDQPVAFDDIDDGTEPELPLAELTNAEKIVALQAQLGEADKERAQVVNAGNTVRARALIADAKKRHAKLIKKGEESAIEELERELEAKRAKTKKS